MKSNKCEHFKTCAKSGGILDSNVAVYESTGCSRLLSCCASDASNNVIWKSFLGRQTVPIYCSQEWYDSYCKPGSKYEKGVCKVCKQCRAAGCPFWSEKQSTCTQSMLQKQDAKCDAQLKTGKNCAHFFRIYLDGFLSGVMLQEFKPR